MNGDEPQPVNACPAPWCGKARSECAHVECWRRITLTARPPGHRDWDDLCKTDDEDE